MPRLKPVVRLNGRRVSARRAIYEETTGTVLCVTQRLKPSCNNFACVNPDHQVVLGLVAPDAPAWEDPPPDEPWTVDAVYDLILIGKSRDPDELARNLPDVPIDLILEALALLDPQP